MNPASAKFLRLQVEQIQRAKDLQGKERSLPTELKIAQRKITRYNHATYRLRAQRRQKIKSVADAIRIKIILGDVKGVVKALRVFKRQTFA